MFIPTSLNMRPRIDPLAIPAYVSILAVVLILILRRCCPHRLPRCMRPSIEYQLSAADSGLDEIFVNTCSFCTHFPLKYLYPNSSEATGYPSCTAQSMCQTFPSVPGASGSDDLPGLHSVRRGLKRKTMCSSDDESDDESNDSMLEAEYYLNPLTEAEVIRRLEEAFTGEIPDGGKPEFFIYHWKKQIY